MPKRKRYEIERETTVREVPDASLLPFPYDWIVWSLVGYFVAALIRGCGG